MKERNDGLKAIYASSYARVHFSMTFIFIDSNALEVTKYRVCYESKRK